MFMKGLQQATPSADRWMIIFENARTHAATGIFSKESFRKNNSRSAFIALGPTLLRGLSPFKGEDRKGMG
jgi:hypothetical protein